MIRGLISLCVILAIVWFGATVKLGKKTTFGHIQSIWKSEATQEMVEGVKETGGPVVDKVKRGIEAGVREASSDDHADADAEKAAAARAKADAAQVAAERARVDAERAAADADAAEAAAGTAAKPEKKAKPGKKKPARGATTPAPEAVP